MNYKIMGIEDFSAIEFTNDLKKKYGLKACNNFQRCMFELRIQSEGSFLLSELDHNNKNVVRMMVAPDGTPTLFIMGFDTKCIYEYTVNNYKWTRKHITLRDVNQWIN